MPSGTDRFVQPSSPTRAGLSLVLLIYFLGIIGVITLAPFRFATPRAFHVLTTGGTFDIVTNVLLFVPLGFLYPLTRARNEETSPVRVFVLALLLSSAIELAQEFERDRSPSVIDALTNALGAMLGAMLVRAITRRIRVNAKLVGRLSLEIPLIGLIYLLVPLLLVASLSGVSQPPRLAALVPLGLVGARLMSSVQRNHFGPAGVIDARSIALIAAGWMVVGTFPILLSHPLIGIALVALVGLTTWYESSRPLDALHSADRRFEAEALRSAAPYIAVYFAALAFLPLGVGVRAWRFQMGLTGSRNIIAQQQLRLLEPVASLTVLGYLLAEARGRREQSFATTAKRLAVECAGLALVVEGLRGFQRGAGASGWQFLLMIAAGLLGAGIYHNQRQHVRWILAHRADTGHPA